MTATHGKDGSTIPVAGVSPAVAHLPDAVSLHDLEGVFVYASPVFAELFGWQPEDLVGRDAYELFHPFDLPDIHASHSSVAAGAVPSVRYRLRRSDGSYRWVETTSCMTPEGRIASVTRIMHDRSSLLQALQDQRAVAQRLHEVDQERQAFLTAIAHRLRHPMTAVLGFAHLLQQGQVTDPVQLQHIHDRLAVNAESLSGLVEVATTAEELSRRANTVRRRPVDLVRLVREAASAFWGLDDAGTTSVVLDLSGPALVLADAERLSVLVEALCSNVVKHASVEAKVWVRLRPDPDGWLLVVEDDGPGIADGRKQDVFSRLSHGHHDGSQPDPGLGLGLYLVHQIAHAHDGRAWVEDRDGGGASFRVLLPAASGQPTRSRL